MKLERSIAEQKMLLAKILDDPTVTVNRIIHKLEIFHLFQMDTQTCLL